MERDGNPIFDGRNYDLDRGFRVIQSPPHEPGDISIGAWVKHDVDAPTVLPRDELVIHLCLSEESAKIAESLLATWMEPSTTGQEMKDFIYKLIPPSPGSLADD